MRNLVFICFSFFLYVPEIVSQRYFAFPEPGFEFYGTDSLKIRSSFNLYTEGIQYLDVSIGVDSISHENINTNKFNVPLDTGTTWTTFSTHTIFPDYILKNGTNHNLIYHIKYDTTSTTILIPFYYTENENAKIISVLYTNENISGRLVPVFKSAFNYLTDTLFLDTFLKLESSVGKKIYITLNSTTNNEEGFEKIVRLDSDSSHYGNYTICLGAFPESYRNGGKSQLMASFYNESKQLIADIPEFSFFVIGAKTTSGTREIQMDGYLMSEYSNGMLDTLFRISMILATSDEYSLMNSLLSTENKRLFLNHFWKKRDVKDEEYLPNFQEFMSRIQAAQVSNLNYLGTPFWKTDRGRVLLTYGLPDEITIEPFGQNTVSISEWAYRSIEGGVYFIFIDFNRNNEYRLVHSTKRGELYNPHYLDLNKQGRNEFVR